MRFGSEGVFELSGCAEPWSSERRAVARPRYRSPVWKVGTAGFADIDATRGPTSLRDNPNAATPAKSLGKS